MENTFQNTKPVYHAYPAKQGKRFANYIIDLIIIYILVIVMAIVYGAFLGAFYPEQVDSFLDENSGTMWYYLAFAAVHIFYYTTMESVFGRTFGKMITNTKVVTEDGETPDTATAFMRSLSRLVPFNAFSFLGDPPRGWHDQWTNTYVVDRK